VCPILKKYLYPHQPPCEGRLTSHAHDQNLVVPSGEFCFLWLSPSTTPFSSHQHNRLCSPICLFVFFCSLSNTVPPFFRAYLGPPPLTVALNLHRRCFFAVVVVSALDFLSVVFVSSLRTPHNFFYARIADCFPAVPRCVFASGNSPSFILTALDPSILSSSHCCC